MGRVFGGVTSFADALELRRRQDGGDRGRGGGAAARATLGSAWRGHEQRQERGRRHGPGREMGRVGRGRGRAPLARTEKSWEIEADAQALVGVWAWATRARREQQKGEKVPPMPSTLADSATIRHTLTTLARYGLAGNL